MIVAALGNSSVRKSHPEDRLITLRIDAQYARWPTISAHHFVTRLDVSHQSPAMWSHQLGVKRLRLSGPRAVGEKDAVTSFKAGFRLVYVVMLGVLQVWQGVADVFDVGNGDRNTFNGRLRLYLLLNYRGCCSNPANCSCCCSFNSSSIEASITASPTSSTFGSAR